MIRWEFKKRGLVWNSKIEYNNSPSISYKSRRGPLCNTLLERHRNELEKNIVLNRVMDVLVHKSILEIRYGTHATREMLDI